ncbi:MAG: hypothetical protein F6J98_35840 [Moorea sp. SIO4G2]|nr:hypothetical protein [Moorena sp. SIO4G2]
MRSPHLPISPSPYSLLPTPHTPHPTPYSLLPTPSLTLHKEPDHTV